MRSMFFFVVAANAIAAVLVSILSLFVPFLQAMKVIDLMFFTGVIFWLISSVIRLGSQRVKKDWKRDEVIVTDPQIVLSTSNLAARFLIAGIPGIAGAIIWGFFY